MRHVLAWSGGKDSTASGILARLHNLPLDAIVTVQPDPFALELGFTERFEDFMQMAVQVLPGPTFEDFFYQQKTARAKFSGDIYGWPMTIYKTCARIMKIDVINTWRKSTGGDTVAIVGIAGDEYDRLPGLRDSGDISYLETLGVTERDAWALCEQYDLLNPLYAYFDRLGCVRCPKQSIEALRIVRELEPEKWAWALEHDAESPVTFKPDGRTFCDLERRFAAGDRWADGRTFAGRVMDAGQKSYWYVR